MQFIQGQQRNQTYFATLDHQVKADNSVRLMDAFIAKLDLQQSGFQKTVYKTEGRPPYETRRTFKTIPVWVFKQDTQQP